MRRGVPPAGAVRGAPQQLDERPIGRVGRVARPLNDTSGSIATKAMDKVLATARRSGALSLAERGLKAIPQEVYNLLDQSAMPADEKWWECVDLKSLDMTRNDLTGVTAQIANLATLEVLVLSYNRLSDLPPEVYSLTALKKLDLAHNALSSLSSAVGALNQLVELNLAENKLTALPESVGELKQLEVLTLDSNEISQLPANLGSLRLIRLTADSNRLESLPTSVSQLTRLQTMSIKRNRLRQLPDLRKLSALTVLDASENQLSEVPLLPASGALSQLLLGFNHLSSLEGVEDAKGLVTLDVHDNKITELPQALAHLKALKILDVANNELADLPVELGTLAALNKLVLDGNPFKKFPRSKLTAGINALKKYLVSRLAEDHAENKVPDGVSPIDYALRDAGASRSLTLRKQNLKEVPHEVFNLSELVSLDLSENGLQELPDDVDVFARSLKSLVLEQNRFTRIPAVVCRLQQLTALNMRHNGITALPPQLATLRLVSLDLRNNRLSTFPTEVLRISSLRHLFLGFNKIATLPDVTPLTELETLDLGNNALTQIADGLRYLPRLSSLNVENNNLSTLPLELAVCPALKALMIAGNPQRLLKPEVIARGTPAILAALREKIPFDSPLLAEEAPAPRGAPSVNGGSSRAGSASIRPSRVPDSGNLRYDNSRGDVAPELRGFGPSPPMTSAPRPPIREEKYGRQQERAQHPPQQAGRRQEDPPARIAPRSASLTAEQTFLQRSIDDLARQLADTSLPTHKKVLLRRELAKQQAALANV